MKRNFLLKKIGAFIAYLTSRTQGVKSSRKESGAWKAANLPQLLSEIILTFKSPASVVNSFPF